MISTVKTSISARFSRSYLDLDPGQQEQIDNAIKEYCKNPHGPHRKRLKVHKLGGVKGTPSGDNTVRPAIWDMHAPGPLGELIVTFQVEPDLITFRNCGPHDAVLKNP